MWWAVEENVLTVRRDVKPSDGALLAVLREFCDRRSTRCRTSARRLRRSFTTSFDLIVVAGLNRRHEPFEKRRALLERVLPKLTAPAFGRISNVVLIELQRR